MSGSQIESHVLTIKRSILFSDGDFQGFQHSNSTDYNKRILEHHEFILREKAEQDETYKQPICYAVIVQNGKVLVYQRPQKANEKRLVSKWSIGIGGHIHPFDGENPLEESMKREVLEEIGIQTFSSTLLGFVNDDSDAVGRVHMGVIYIIISNETVQPQPELSNANFIATSELVSFSETHDFEGWSKLILPHIISFLRK